MKPAALFYKISTSCYLSLVFRLYIAGIFVYAGMYKISYTAEFAETIAGYQMVPYWGVNFLAAILPWIELICGILLAAGVRARAAACVLGALMAVFTVGIAWNLILDSPIGCGCFSSVEEAISWRTLVRDSLWLAMIVHIFFFDKAFHLEKKYAFRLEEIQS